jgi:hypothetical protein
VRTWIDCQRDESNVKALKGGQHVAATGEGRMLTYTPSTAIQADAYSIFDLSFNWSINNTLSLRAGIDNLFDKQPAITGASYGRLRSACPIRATEPPARASTTRWAAGSTSESRPGCKQQNRVGRSTQAAEATSPLS